MRFVFFIPFRCLMGTFNNIYYNQTNYYYYSKLQMDKNMKFRESMGDVFALVTKQGQAHVNKALQMVTFPEHL